MGAVKWTGEGFKLVGRILTNEDFENWLKQEGAELLKKQLEKIAMPWLFGTRRAKSTMERTLPGFEGASDTFRTALSHELESLPRLLGRTADVLRTNGPKELVEEKNYDWVVAVPRRVIRKVYQDRIIAELGDAAALSSFPGLARRLLISRAEEAEDEFFKGMQRKAVLAEGRSIVLGTSFDTQWWQNEIKGHYYVGHDYVGLSLDGERNIAEVAKELAPMKERLHDRIGRMTTNTMKAALASLDTLQ